jgi:gliding motility-associated-like protein
MAQTAGRFNNWYFGTNAGVSFASGAPVALTNGALVTTEGSASISDENGNLLFYTDGVTVWNRNHAAMTNGTGLHGHSSSTQSAIIVQRPGSTTLYYIFTADADAGVNGIKYSEVNMTLSGGLGAVTANKNVSLRTPSCEKLTAVRHCNNRDLWIVSHDWNSNAFRTWLVTDAGVNLTPVVSNVGVTATGVTQGSYGQLKANPDGNRLVASYYGTSSGGVNRLETYAFNNQTGGVSNALTLATDVGLYGTEFSPDGRIVYAGTNQGLLLQYNLCAGSNAAIVASRFVIGNLGPFIGSLQLGPDNKVYVARNAVALSVISNPNATGAACGYTNGAISLSGRSSRMGLPNMASFYLRPDIQPFTVASNCLNATFTSPTAVTSSNSCSGAANAIQSVEWNFGDPASGASNVSTSLNPTHTFSAVGSYSVRLVLNLGCYNDTLIQTVNVNGFVLNTSTTPASCGASNGTATATPAVAGSYTYLWNNGQQTATATGLVAGNYTCAVTAASGCSSVASVTVASGGSVQLNVSAPNISCHGATTLATAVASGGSAPYSYLWSNGLVGASVALGAGAYSVTTTDANGCSATQALSITQPVALSVALTAQNALCANATGSASSSVSGGNAPYAYSWSNGSSASSITNLSPGNYSLTVTDAYGCQASSSVTISAPAVAISVQTSVVNAACAASNGQATATAIGGAAPYSYSWSNGSITQSISNLAAGSYHVTVTDANGCTGSGSAIVSTLSAPQLSLNITQPTCFNGTGSAVATAAGGSAPYTIVWSTGTFSNSLNGIQPGNYSVSLTDNGGCSTSQNFSIVAPAAVTISINATLPLCAGGNASLQSTVSGGASPYSYLWSNGSQSQNITAAASGTYSLIVTDANGCAANASRSVTMPAALNASFTLNQPACFGATGSASIIVSGGTTPYSYVWSNGALGTSASALTSGPISVTITDAQGCQLSQSGTISVPAVLTAQISSQQSTCGAANGSISVAVNGGTAPYDYSWSNGATTASLANLPAGAYALTITDNAGCTLSQSTDVQSAGSISVVANSVTAVRCNGDANGVAEAIVTGGTAPYQFVWSNGATQSLVGGMAAGTYSVTATDANGCSASASVSMIEPQVLSVQLQNMNVTCNGSADGSISTQVSGGTSPYTYNWSNGASTSSLSALSSGLYQVEVLDAQNCLAIQSVTLSEPAALSVVETVASIGCFGAANGSVNLQINGGSAPFNTTWSNGSIGTTLSNLGSGIYSYTVTDAMSCSVSGSVTIDEPSDLALASVISLITCSTGNDGSIEVVPSGGTAPYVLLWNNGSSQSQVSNLSAGNYSVILTDAAGCVHSENFDLEAPAAILVNATATASSCIAPSGSISVQANGGAGILQYSLNGAASQFNSVFNALAAGQYDVTVSDASGCSVTSSVTVPSPANLSANVSNIIGVSCPGVTDGSATLEIFGGTAPFNVLWSSQEVGMTASMLNAGAHDVTVTDAAGCNFTANFVVDAPQAIQLIPTLFNPTCFGASNGSISINTVGGTGALALLWDNGITSSTISNLSAASYSVMATDQNGCTVKDTFELVQPLVLAQVAEVVSAGCNNNEGSISLNVNGGTAPYSFSWAQLPAIITAQAGNLNAGSYAVSITDAQQCSLDTIITVGGGNPVIAVVDSTHDVRCFGQSNGFAFITVSGGTLPYQYDWGQGVQSQLPVSWSAGTYQLSISDASGCDTEVSFSIQEPAALQALLNSTHVSCNGNADGMLLASVSGGTAPYQYVWSNGANTAQIEDLSAGSYELTVTDASSCLLQLSAGVQQPQSITIELTAVHPACNTIATGSLNATVNGGTGQFTYSWSNGASAAQLDGLTAGLYQVTVNDAAGCQAEASAELISAAPFTVSISGDRDICYGDQTVLTAVSSDIHGTYQYTWSHGEQVQSVAVMPSENTIFTAVLTDSTGCSAFSTAEVNVKALPQIEVVTNDTAGCAPFCSLIEVNGTGASYAWTLSNGQTFNGTENQVCFEQPGVYSMSVNASTADGCATTYLWNNTIEVFARPDASFTVSDSDISLEDPVVQFNSNVAGASSYTYYFGDPNNNYVMAPQTQYTYSDTGSFEVTLEVKNDYGCSDQAVRTIHVGGFTAFYIPNAFTPNGDGTNDVFMPKATGLSPDGFELSIYDRWGHVVFVSTEWGKGWDGTLNGVPVQADVYVCKVRYFDKKGRMSDQIGSVTISE